MFLSLVSSLAFSADPSFMRPADVQAIPFEEIAMVPPGGGCNGFTACMAVANWSPTWMSVEVPEYGMSNVNTNRVFTSDAIYTGIYLDSYPVYGGEVVVTLGNQQITVPAVVNGNFVSAIRPCLRTGSVPKGYMRVSPRIPSISLVGHTMVVTGDDRSLTIAFDAVKGVLVQAPLKAFGTMAGVYSVRRDLYDANGTPISYGRPFTDTAVGPHKCRA